MVVIPLQEANGSSEVGGKAARLGALMQIGTNVPNGFVVVPDNGTTELDEVDADTLLHYFGNLHVQHVAVRSSTTVEDSDDASWAGQFDTFLFVDRESLIDKVEGCIASVNSTRSTAYAHAMEEHARPSIAVIVQAMVPSDVSGVCFSVHPVTQDANQIVIEAAYGLGEAVVSGEVTPDNYVVSRQPRRIIQKTVASQPRAYAFSETLKHTTWVNVPTPDAQKLTDAQILELAATADSLERHFKHPVDVEWAFYQDKLYILQSRPITTLA